MPDLQEQLNKILSNPEALKQVQSLGEQLGLTKSEAAPPPPPKPQNNPANSLPSMLNDDMLKAITNLAPIMQSMKKEDDATRLLNSLRPFLSEEKKIRLDKAEKMIRMIKIFPLLKNNGLF